MKHPRSAVLSSGGAGLENLSNMSNTLELKTPEEFIVHGYSDVKQYSKKATSSDEPRKESSKVDQIQAEKDADMLVSENDSTALMERIRTFSRDGFEITNCIFRKNQIEICYIFDGCHVVHTKDELRQQLAAHLKISTQLIKMTKLRAKPVYKETTIRPGETTTIQLIRPCKIGAFVNVQDKGNHVLLSGHGKSEGDVILYPDGNRLGFVNVSLHPSRQPRPVNWYQDVALAKLEQQNGYTAKVDSADHGELSLEQQPGEAEDGMSVRCFNANGNRGTVDTTAYNRRDEQFKIFWRLIAVKNDEGEPIHEEGDSGTLIVHDEANTERVRAVGMLVGIDELPLDDELETTIRTSVAVPLTTSFQALQTVDYCKELAIDFLQ